MKLKVWCLFAFGLLAMISPGFANDAAVTNRLAEVVKLVKSLKYQHGQIAIPGGLAKLNLPTNISYLDPNDAETVLVKLWGNPPSEKTLGMLIPTDKTPMDDDCWAVTITSTEDGYVKDDDAAKIKYDELLKQMQDSVHENNKARAEKGYPTFELIGWAEPPHYDAANHKLYWAKELKVEGATENTLNYDIRILGRKSYLELSAIAAMSQLKEIKKESPEILNMVEFNEGSRYTDFDPKIDKVATYGIAALVLGGIAAKAGFFKLLIVGLIAAKKFIIIGVVAVGAWAKRFFGKRNDPTA